MKVAHLILAHKNAAQVEKLIDALSHPDFHFFLHIDKKTNVGPFMYLLDKQNVHVIENRAKVFWASFGTIQATINGFKEILPYNFEYINVISAQDFPLKSARYIHDFLSNCNRTEFITCESIEDEWKEARPRIYNYHFTNWRIPGKYKMEVIANKILPKRKFPLDYVIVGRANWFTITSDAAKYILSTMKQHPSVIRYFKFCWGADEFIFSTILYNSPFQKKIRNNLVYVDWEGCYEGHPRTLSVQDFDKLMTTNKLFARKFDIQSDAMIIDMLEKHIKQQEMMMVEHFQTPLPD